MEVKSSVYRVDCPKCRTPLHVDLAKIENPDFIKCPRCSVIIQLRKRRTGLARAVGRIYGGLWAKPRQEPPTVRRRWSRRTRLVVASINLVGILLAGLIYLYTERAKEESARLLLQQMIMRDIQDIAVRTGNEPSLSELERGAELAVIIRKRGRVPEQFINRTIGALIDHVNTSKSVEEWENDVMTLRGLDVLMSDVLTQP